VEGFLRPTPRYSWSIKVITDHKSCTFYNTSQTFLYEVPVIEWISHLGFLLKFFLLNAGKLRKFARNIFSFLTVYIFPMMSFIFNSTSSLNYHELWTVASAI